MKILKTSVYIIGLIIFLAICTVHNGANNLWHKILLFLAYFGGMSVIIEFIFGGKIQLHTISIDSDEKPGLRVASFAFSILLVGISIYGLSYGLNTLLDPSDSR